MIQLPAEMEVASTTGASASVSGTSISASVSDQTNRIFKVWHTSELAVGSVITLSMATMVRNPPSTTASSAFTFGCYTVVSGTSYTNEVTTAQSVTPNVASEFTSVSVTIQVSTSFALTSTAYFYQMVMTTASTISPGTKL